MVSRESLLENFEGLGIEPSDNILDKCIEICNNYCINDPEMFVDQWMSYTLSYLNNEAPTIATLEEMARKEFTKKTFQTSNDPDVDYSVYNQGGFEDDEIDASIMESYNICTTPKAKKLLKSKVAASPTCYSPFTPTAKTTQSTSGKDPSVSGKVVYTFGKPNHLEAGFSSSNKIHLNIFQVPLNKHETLLTCDDKFLYDKFSNKCTFESVKFNEIGLKICDKYFTNNTKLSTQPSTNAAADDESQELEASLYAFDELSKLDTPSPKQIFCVGRVASDSDGQLTENSTLLISNDENKLCSQRIDFTNMPSFAIFPGQIILSRGMHPRMDNFYVHEVISDTELTLPKSSEEIKQPISVIIASGPFTDVENVDYAPLRSLIDYCATHKPKILILIGPFFDVDNQMLLEGFSEEDFDEVFNKMVADLAKGIGLETQILIVSSCRDIRSWVYPTHPYPSIKGLTNVTMLPDPCIVNVNDFKIGITAVDTLYHMLNEELVRNPREDKIKRCINNLLHQQTFYPLNPPNIDVPYDSTLAAKYAVLPFVPNMLILPSEDLKVYVRDINNCLSLNPGRLVSTSGGTFAKMVINPATAATSGTDKLMDYIACQIIKI